MSSRPVWSASSPRPQLDQRSRILAADGSLIAYLYLENRVPVQLERVPRSTRDAVVAIEDARFYVHPGIDVKGVLRAALTNGLSGDVKQGASTLTQQYVKNALLAEADTPQERAAAQAETFERKLREARYALQLERELTKDEILERYLNIAYYGNGAYGIGTAASYYFGKPVAELSVAEGALLAGIVQSPARLDPVARPEAARVRRNVVLARMTEVGLLPEPERRVAAALPLGLDVKPIASGCEAPGTQAPFFCDYVRRALEDGPLGAALGDTREERQKRLLGGGLTIKTTLNPGIQQTAISTLNREIPQDDPSGVAATYTAVQPGTGEVLALAVNRTFGEGDAPGQTKLNLPLGGSSGMQAGSTFKPFVLAAALHLGLPLDTTFDAPAEYVFDVFKNCDGTTCDAPYVVHNAGDSEAGRFDLVSGTRNSVNTYFVQLEEKTGVEEPAQIAEAFGLRQFSRGEPSAPLHRGGSFTLGVVDTMSSILRGVVDGPWSHTARRASIGRPVAGKTGTTNGSKAAWFLGYTPQIAAAVWVGKPVPEPLRNITIHGTHYRQVYGGTLPAPLWSLIMGHVLRNQPVVELPPPAISHPTPPEPEPRSSQRGRTGAQAVADARAAGG